MQFSHPNPGLDLLLPGARQASLPPRDHGGLHLRDDQGRFWELVPEGPEAAALRDHALAGRGVALFGRVEADLNTVRVARLQLD